MNPDSPTLAALRRLLLFTLVLGVSGNAIELLLLGHVEDWWQRVPLALSAVLLMALLWVAFSRGAAAVCSRGRLAP